MVFLVLLSPLVYGQTSFMVSGKVVDDQNIPVSIGDAVLFTTEKEVPIKYAMINDGKFSFDAIEEGNYRLRISCLGFKDMEQTFELHQNLVLTVQLAESPTSLDEVEVVGSKSIFTHKNGNLKINVENPIFSSIPDPLDLLSKLPNILLSPDRESLTVIGKGSPLIYIGNQRITLEEFNALSTDDISTIEIITAPSAKYEAEGRSVLLVTRKISNTAGIKTNLSETVSFKRNFNNFFGIGSSYKKNKLTLKGNLAYNNLQTWESNGFEFRIPQRDILTDYLALVPDNDRLQINGGTGLFYQINTEDYFSLNVNLRAQTDAFIIETDTFLKEGDTVDNIRTETSNGNSKDFFSGNFNYNKKLAPGMDLFIGVQYSSFMQKLETDISNNFNDTEFVRSQKRRQKYRIDALAYRLDVEKTFKNEMKWELGANINEANADALTQIQDFEMQNDIDIDYDYTEKTYASYTQLSGKIDKKISYSAGLRIESNNVRGEFTTEDTPLVNRKNTNLFPKVNMDFPIDSTKNITINYAKSIGRPNFSNASSITTFINPFLEFSRNINLKPTLTDEWSANFQWKKNAFYMGYYKRKNPIYYSVRFDEQVNRAIFSPTNLAKESGIDISITIPFTYRFWTATNTATVSSRKIEDPAAIVNNTDPYLYYYTNHQFKIAKDTTVSLGGWGLTKRNEGVFKRNALFVLDAAISKTFFEKLQCSLRFNDITRAMNFEESYTINGIKADGVFFTDAREAALTLKYSFGKIKEPDYKNKDVDENLDRIK